MLLRNCFAKPCLAPSQPCKDTVGKIHAPFSCYSYLDCNWCHLIGCVLFPDPILAATASFVCTFVKRLMHRRPSSVRVSLSRHCRCVRTSVLLLSPAQCSAERVFNFTRKNDRITYSGLFSAAACGMSRNSTFDWDFVSGTP